MAPRIVAARQRRSLPDLSPIEEQFQQVRSLLACATRTLDEIVDPHHLDATEACGPDDVATLLRVAIERLNLARDALDQATPVVPRKGGS
jgi:hypothetical protein